MSEVATWDHRPLGGGYCACGQPIHTGPAHPDRQGTREELAAALQLHRLTTPRQCLCGWRQDGNWSDFAWGNHATDVLLPVVERLCDQRAAEALESAATDWWKPGRPHRPVRDWLRDRAEALRAKP